MPRFNQGQQISQAQASATALLFTERRIGGEFIFVQDECLTIRANPHVQQQVDLLNPFFADRRGLRNVAVPAFTPAVRAGDREDIKPAIRVIVFDKVIPGLEDGIAQVAVRIVPVRVQNNPIFQASTYLCWIPKLLFTQGTTFYHSNHYLSKEPEGSVHYSRASMQIEGEALPLSAPGYSVVSRYLWRHPVQLLMPQG